MSEIATLAGGCFWCLEAVFDEVEGVVSVESGYTGGTTRHPSYVEVCTGETGHAEAVRITFEPAKVSYRDLLEIFFAIHDPTTLNRQGNDIGTQYRSAIFCHTPDQEVEARGMIAKLTESGAFESPIVTEVGIAGEFWEAEAYHQEYFRSNPNQPYCMFAVSPKVEKFRKKFAAKRKR